MLDQLALSYIANAGNTIPPIYGALFIGAVLAAVVDRNEDWRMARAPYFAYSALVGLMIAAFQLVWLNVDAAVTNGYLWLFMVTDLGSTCAGGFLIGRFAMGRSRDLRGNARLLPLAFIPIANLYLLFAASPHPDTGHSFYAPRGFSGGLGVVAGFAMLVVAAGVSGFVEQRMMTKSASSPAVEAFGPGSIQSMVDSNGLEPTLRMLATSTRSELPIRIDEVTNLVRVEANGHALQRTFRVDRASFELRDRFRGQIDQAVCGDAYLRTLLDAGAAVEERYTNAAGELAGSHKVTGASCSK